MGRSRRTASDRNFCMQYAFPEDQGTITALIMIASSLCNYTILTAAAKMQPSQVMVMNIVLTAVGVALGLFVNVRYGVLLKNAEEA